MFSYRSLAYGSALVAGLSLFSGTASALSFGAGPLLGINLANASVDYPGSGDVESGMLTRFAFGARAEFGVTSPFSLLLEPMYLQRGVSQKATFLGLTVESETRLNYLEVPVLAKAKFGSMKAHAYAFAGPSLGIFLNGETEAGNTTTDADSISAINLSGDIGVGGSFQVQEFIYLNADVRYSHGFTNQADVKDEDVEMMSRDIRLQLCVLFHLTK